MAGNRFEVADLSASHELLSETLADLKAAADSDSTGVRGEGSVLRSQLSKSTFRLASIEASRVSPDIGISGIPASIADSPRTTVLKVFEALGIPELAVDVLDVRSLSKRDSSVIGNRQQPWGADGSSWSFMVTLHLLNIRDHIISRNRLTQTPIICKVSAMDRPGKTYVC